MIGDQPHRQPCHATGGKQNVDMDRVPLARWIVGIRSGRGVGQEDGICLCPQVQGLDSGGWKNQRQEKTGGQK